jgi:alginate O-acetyltransferase complex protein AlgI
MNFVSYAFLVLILLAILSRLTIGRNSNTSVYLSSLLFFSLIFYAWHTPIYLFLLLFTTFVNYSTAFKIQRENNSQQTRKLYLIITLIINLGILGYFKYTYLALDFIGNTLNLIPASENWREQLQIILPIGISFYTFQAISYSVDVYRGTIKPENSFKRLLLYISFFPQLVAGPIIRARDFLYQFDRPRKLHCSTILEGCYLIISGLFLKIVVSDYIGDFLSGKYDFWGSAINENASATHAWFAAFLFSIQIFGDFAGYTSIARGIAYLFGFQIQINFNNPYLARSFSDFWRRWHISLSQWLREYLYIPLGGNKKGKTRTYINLILVMLLGGLWHGAAWTFIAWGGIHGLALAIERLLGINNTGNKHGFFLNGLKGICWFLIVQITLLLTWTMFRADSFSDAFAIYSNMFGGKFRLLDWNDNEHFARESMALALSLLVIIMHARAFLSEITSLKPYYIFERAMASAFMLYCIFTIYAKSNQFIYFQF